jgi:hypothetical protein
MRFGINTNFFCAMQHFLLAPRKTAVHIAPVPKKSIPPMKCRRLAAAIVLRGLSISDVERASGVHRTTISSILSGNRWSDFSFKKISAAVKRRAIPEDAAREA